MKLHVIDNSQDGTTGHIVAKLRIIDDTDPEHPVDGKVEMFGIDPLELEKRYGGDAEKWLRWCGRQMAHRHKRLRIAHSDLGALKGKHLDIGNGS